MTLAVNIAQSGSNNVTFRNRIINGAMVIDQRNAGAAWGTSINGYTVDRWQCVQSVTGKLNGGQNYNSITPPTGFSNYIGVQSQSAYSVGATDYYNIFQPIEGFNTYDLAWGTASAATVTLSFWVRSSLTGTFGGVIRNSAANYNYPFTYTISVANTWEQKTVTIAGPTSGTWIGATNGNGAGIWFGLGVGSTYSATAGTWTTTSATSSATGATSVVGTNGATFYITGVQLEAGTTASPFEYRQYGTELALCQRYYEIIGQSSNSILFQGYVGGVDAIRSPIFYKVNKRTTPTMTINGTWSSSNKSAADAFIARAGVDAGQIEWVTSGAGVSYFYNQNAGNTLTINAEL